MVNDEQSKETVPSPRENFIYNTFFVIVDKLLAEIEKRRAAYTKLNDMFGFCTDKHLSVSEIRIKAKQLVKSYPDDLESDFVNEFVIFRNICNCDAQELNADTDMLQMQVSKKLTNSFSNVNIALRIYQSIFGTSCEGERTFSVLKRVKNYQSRDLLWASWNCNSVTTINRVWHHATTGTALSLLSIECGIMRQLDVDALIANCNSVTTINRMWHHATTGCWCSYCQFCDAKMSAREPLN